MNTPFDAEGGRRASGAWTPAEADWLALRRDADEQARDEGAAPLLARLCEHLRQHDVARLEVVDVGAGTGSNGRYLRPRLPCRQRWVVVDRDEEHLRHPDHGDAERLRAGVEDLPDLLDRRPVQWEPRLVTCAALLDVLNRAALGALAEAVARSGGRALLALTVDGQVSWDPADRLDAAVAKAFDEHQRRDDRPGPDAARELGGLLRERGLEVTAARTRWRLGPGREALLGRFVDGRVEAVLEQDPRLRPEVLAWHARRTGQLASGRLGALVSHVDLLVLPR